MLYKSTINQIYSSSSLSLTYTYMKVKSIHTLKKISHQKIKSGNSKIKGVVLYFCLKKEIFYFRWYIKMAAAGATTSLYNSEIYVCGPIRNSHLDWGWQWPQNCVSLTPCHGGKTWSEVFSGKHTQTKCNFKMFFIILFFMLKII